MIPKAIIQFVLILVIILIAIFGIHVAVLHFFEKPLFSNKIILSYLINALLAAIILFSLEKLKERYRTQIGFLFLFGSTLKFVVFFILFYPGYKSDGVMDKMEFAAFFVPYVVCLVLETYSLSRMLNKMS